MKSRKWGRIISTASAHSLVASPFKSAYVTAKHGLAGLTKTVALEARDLRHHLQLHQPRLCVDAAGREANTRHGESARHDRGTGQARCDLGGAADQRIRHRRRSREPRRLSLLRCRRRRSPAPIFRSTAAGPQREPVRLHDKTALVAVARPRAGAKRRAEAEAHQSGAARRRRARRLHLGRAGTAFERRAACHRGHFRHVGGRGECRDAGRRSYPRRPRGGAEAARRFLARGVAAPAICRPCSAR